MEFIDCTCGCWSLTIGAWTFMGFQFHTQWMYLMWGGPRVQSIAMQCWVVQWCLYPHYQMLFVPNVNIKQGENTLLRGQDCCHIIFFLEVPCLNFNHVIIMKDFHNVFAYYGRSKPKKVKFQIKDTF